MPQRRPRGSRAESAEAGDDIAEAADAILEELSCNGLPDERSELAVVSAADGSAWVERAEVEAKSTHGHGDEGATPERDGEVASAQTEVDLCGGEDAVVSADPENAAAAPSRGQARTRARSRPAAAPLRPSVIASRWEACLALRRGHLHVRLSPDLLNATLHLDDLRSFCDSFPKWLEHQFDEGLVEGKLVLNMFDASCHYLGSPCCLAFAQLFSAEGLVRRRFSQILALKLYRNNIGDAGALILADWLCTADFLQELHLSHNQICDDGCMAILMAGAASASGTRVGNYEVKRRSSDAESAMLWIRLDRNWIDTGQVLRRIETCDDRLKVRIMAGYDRFGGYRPSCSIFIAPGQLDDHPPYEVLHLAQFLKQGTDKDRSTNNKIRNCKEEWFMWDEDQDWGESREADDTWKTAAKWVPKQGQVPHEQWEPEEELIEDHADALQEMSDEETYEQHQQQRKRKSVKQESRENAKDKAKEKRRERALERERAAEKEPRDDESIDAWNEYGPVDESEWLADEWSAWPKKGPRWVPKKSKSKRGPWYAYDEEEPEVWDDLVWEKTTWEKTTWETKAWRGWSWGGDAWQKEVWSREAWESWHPAPRDFGPPPHPAWDWELQAVGAHAVPADGGFQINPPPLASALRAVLSPKPDWKEVPMLSMRGQIQNEARLLPRSQPTVQNKPSAKRKAESAQELERILDGLRVVFHHVWLGEDGEKYTFEINKTGAKVVLEFDEGDEHVELAWHCTCTRRQSVELSRLQYNVNDGLLWWEDVYFVDPDDLATAPEKVFWRRIGMGPEFYSHVWYRHYGLSTVATKQVAVVAEVRGKKRAGITQQSRSGVSAVPAAPQDRTPEVAVVKVRHLFDGRHDEDPKMRARRTLLESGFEDQDILRIYPDLNSADVFCVEVLVGGLPGVFPEDAADAPEASQPSSPSRHASKPREAAVEGDPSPAARPRVRGPRDRRHRYSSYEADDDSDAASWSDVDYDSRAANDGRFEIEEPLWRWVTRVGAKLLLIAWFTMEGSNIVRRMLPIASRHLGLGHFAQQAGEDMNQSSISDL